MARMWRKLFFLWMCLLCHPGRVENTIQTVAGPPKELKSSTSWVTPNGEIIRVTKHVIKLPHHRGIFFDLVYYYPGGTPIQKERDWSLEIWKRTWGTKIMSCGCGLNFFHPWEVPNILKPHISSHRLKYTVKTPPHCCGLFLGWTPCVATNRLLTPSISSRDYQYCWIVMSCDLTNIKTNTQFNPSMHYSSFQTKIINMGLARIFQRGGHTDSYRGYS